MPNAFAPGPSHPSVAPLFTGAALLDAEKLDVYRIALEFQSIASQLVPKRGYAELRDQLDRASISIALNIAVLSFQVTSVSPTHETLLEREGLLAIIWPDHGVRDPLGAIGGQRT